VTGIDINPTGLLNCAVHLHDQLFSSHMSTDADADRNDDNKHNNRQQRLQQRTNKLVNKLTNNHVDVWNVDIVNDWNNDPDDFRSDRRDRVD
jgi:hypothetical protein